MRWLTLLLLLSLSCIVQSSRPKETGGSRHHHHRRHHQVQRSTAAESTHAGENDQPYYSELELLHNGEHRKWKASSTSDEQRHWSHRDEKHSETKVPGSKSTLFEHKGWPHSHSSSGSGSGRGGRGATVGFGGLEKDSSSKLQALAELDRIQEKLQEELDVGRDQLDVTESESEPEGATGYRAAHPHRSSEKEDQKNSSKSTAASKSGGSTKSGTFHLQPETASDRRLGMIEGMVLLAFLVFFVCIVQMLQYPDPQVRSYSYKTVFAIVSIFEALSFVTIQNDVVLATLVDPYVGGRSSALRHFLSFVVFALWFFGSTAICWRIRHDPNKLFAATGILSHICAFVLVEAYASVQIEIAEKLLDMKGMHGVYALYVLAPISMGVFFILLRFVMKTLRKRFAQVACPEALAAAMVEKDAPAKVVAATEPEVGGDGKMKGLADQGQLVAANPSPRVDVDEDDAFLLTDHSSDEQGSSAHNAPGETGRDSVLSAGSDTTKNGSNSSEVGNNHKQTVGDDGKKNEDSNRSEAASDELKDQRLQRQQQQQQQQKPPLPVFQKTAKNPAKLAWKATTLGNLGALQGKSNVAAGVAARLEKVQMKGEVPEKAREALQAWLASAGLCTYDESQAYDHWMFEVDEAENQTAASVQGFLICRLVYCLSVGRIPPTDCEADTEWGCYVSSPSFWFMFGSLFILYIAATWIGTLVSCCARKASSVKSCHNEFNIAFAPNFTLSMLMAMSWCVLVLVRWSLNEGIPGGTAGHRIVNAFAMSPLCVLVIIVMDKFADKALISDASAEALMKTFALCLGLEWEKAVQASIAATIAESAAKQHPALAQLVGCSVLALVLLPTWIWFIVPEARLPVPPRIRMT